MCGIGALHRQDVGCPTANTAHDVDWPIANAAHDKRPCSSCVLGQAASKETLIASEAYDHRMLHARSVRSFRGEMSLPHAGAATLPLIMPAISHHACRMLMLLPA